MIQKGHRVNSPIPLAPPPPTVSSEGKKRDEMIMSQWATPDAIITESEKKLFEDLKGRLKSKANVPPPKEESVKEESRKREREKSREREPTINDRERIRDKDRNRERDRSRVEFDRRNIDRHRRSRSRSRSRNRGSRPHSPINRRYRRRQYSRSRSRSRPRVIEKPVINFPPEPRARPEKKVRTEDSKKNSEKKAKTILPAGGKKLPFIGRMPVFKKQIAANEFEKKNDESQLQTTVTAISNKEMYGPPPPPSSEAPISTPLSAPGTEEPTSQFTMDASAMPHHMMMEDDDDLMPDPAQLMAIMASAPPPPPPPSKAPTKPHNNNVNEMVLPPGIDEAEADSVPKPISDAPIPRKGPLPKDFQDALNIIFPGEKKPDSSPQKAAVTKSPKSDTTVAPVEPPILMHEEITQQNIDMYNAYAAASAYPNQQTTVYTMYEQHPSADLPLDILPVPPPPPPVEPNTTSSVLVPGIANLPVAVPIPQPSNGEVASPVKKAVEEMKVISKLKQKELDELAMLGIDADDMAAQCM